MEQPNEEKTSHDDLKMFLIEQGYGEKEIGQILQRIAECDNKTFRKSIFDSLEHGTFSLDGLIKDALANNDEKISE